MMITLVTPARKPAIANKSARGKTSFMMNGFARLADIAIKTIIRNIPNPEARTGRALTSQRQYADSAKPQQKTAARNTVVIRSPIFMLFQFDIRRKSYHSATKFSKTEGQDQNDENRPRSKEECSAPDAQRFD